MRKIVIGRRRIQQLAKQDATSFLQRNVQPKDPIPKKQEASKNVNISDAIEINEVNWSFEETRYPKLNPPLNSRTWKTENVHFGLTELIQPCINSNIKSLPLQINVDGLPLFKVLEKTCGQYSDSFIVCDAPAKAYIKCIKGHTGYFGCDKCNVEGTHISNRMAFTNLDATRRDNESFRHRRDIEHHLADTVLENILDLDMVECFPMDYMHLICLGVMRKLLNIWMKGKPGEHKISGQQINALSEKLISLSGETASEFARKPRSVSELDRWKATELRQLLLYSGVHVLKDIISDDSYKLFLILSVAIRILCSEQLHCQLYTYADSLLKYFVEGFQTLYGSELVSYNVHGLIHLATDSQKLGVLETFSAFKFENKLQQIKKYVRTPNKPLQQIVHRILESGSNVCKLKSDIKRNWNLSQPHECGPVIDLFNGKQYILLDLNDFQVRAYIGKGKKADSYFFTKSGDLFLVRNICLCAKSNEVFLLGSVYSKNIQCSVSDLKYYKMYFIMEIKDEGGETCEIIPESWFFPEEEECAWPPVKNVSKYVEKKRSPEANWKRYPARKIHVYDTYKAARENLHRAEMTSDLNSEVDETPKRKRLSSVEIARLKNRRTVQNPPQHGSQLGSSPMNFSTLENIVVGQARVPVASHKLVLVTDTELDRGNQTLLENGVTISSEANSDSSMSHPLNLKFGENTNYDDEGNKDLGYPHTITRNANVSENLGSSTFGERDPSQATFENSHQMYGLQFDPQPHSSSEAADYACIKQQRQSPVVTQTNSKSTQESICGCKEADMSETIGLLRRVVRDMSLVKGYIVNLDQKIDLLRANGSFVGDLREDSFALPLPVSTVEEFSAFETTLMKETKANDALMKSFQTCGGDTVVEFVGRALRKVFSEELAIKYSLRGQKGNVDFSATKTWIVLKDTALAIKNLNATEKSTEKAASEWFRHSNERLQKKIKKTNQIT
ncbi:hypothetical protein Ocin01_18871 [Orchesella cincta]|uniref:DUF4806 domain-containing protein n=1 Tax=Orchesella cincta TaxID=48709 RepID=A0A1D2M4H4_ORCCI|nr:hypothetical protein Ocin01_18871 [Orchesella cincta]